MAADPDNPDSVIQKQVLGEKPSGVTLKTIFNDPNYLKSALIFSVVVNLLLFCGVLALLSQRGTSNGATVTPTPTQTTTPTPEVTETPGAQLTRLQKCFKNCDEREFLDTLKSELEKVKYFKANGDFADLGQKECYGYYSEAIAPDKQFRGYYLPKECDSEVHSYKELPTEYRIGNKLFLFNENADNDWDVATVAPAGQTQVVDIVDIIQAQQSLASEVEQRGSEQVRVITAESQKVNEFNQLVQTIVQIKVSEKYQIVYFRNFEEKSFNENGRFWDYNVPNQIQAPIEL